MIKLLSQNVINKIAAGEVVERPASVVKELVENSLDAGASEIQIFIEDFGTKKIQIIDNGSGIKKRDFDKLFHKHATSKISEINDLDQISSFGFRGEALASISSVSEVILTTKNSEDDIASEIITQNGKINQVKPHSLTSGTNIQVLNLFGNIPARKKFLKSKSTENKQILDIINKFILANPEITFSYNIDGVTKKYFPENSKNRVANLLKINSEDLIEINIDSKIKIKGFLIHPRVFIKSRNLQHIFINTRFINDQIISKAVKDGYDTFLMKNQYPGFVLFLEISPDKVDVNVHPRKTEVRFENSSEIYTSVRFGVNQTLLSFIRNQTKERIVSTQQENTLQVNEPKAEFNAFSSDKEKNISDFEEFLGAKKKEEVGLKSSPLKAYLNKKALDFSEEVIKVKEEIQEIELIQNEEKQINNLNLDIENATQLLNSYIITSNEKEIILIDQHAASERYFYEKYLKDLKNKEVESQVLLFPEIYFFEEFEIEAIIKKEDIFKNFGFEIGRFGSDQIKITSVPAFVKLKDFEKIFKRISNDILENEESLNIDHKIAHEIAAILACHTAVRFGDRLAKPEIIQILKNLLLCEDPYNCPHGRPIIQDHSQYDIEKRFKRCGI